MRKTLLAWPDSDGNIHLSLPVHQPALVCLISLTLSPSSLPDFSWLYKSLIVGVAQMNHTLSVSHYHLCCRQHFNPYNFIKHGFDLVCICACTMCMEVIRQLAGVSSLLHVRSPSGVATSLPTEPSHQPRADGY